MALKFTPLDHPSALPFDTATVDVVIGAGVIEHVVHPRASLMELHRVLRPDGLLILTFVPNRWSWTEFGHRVTKSPAAHRRRYTVSQLSRELLDHGFLTVESGQHQLMPSHGTNTLSRRLWQANERLERLPGLRLLCANHWVVARRLRVV